MSPPPLPYSRSTVITRMAINRSLTFPLRIPAFESLSRGACRFYHFYKTACISGLQRSSSNSDFPSGSRLIPFQRKGDRKSTRLNSSHGYISYAVFCLKKKIIHYQYSLTVEMPNRVIAHALNIFHHHSRKTFTCYDVLTTDTTLRLLEFPTSVHSRSRH